MSTNPIHTGDFGLPSGVAAAVEDLERGNRSSVNGLTAHAGGGQGSATALTAAVNRVTTVATANDSVKLPAAVANEIVVVINAAASNSMNVFPSTGDAIDANSANAAVGVAAGTTAVFYCAVAGHWNSVSSSTYTETATVANALTAHAGGGQGSATALTATINRVTTVATAADSVKLPAATAGLKVIAINAAAANAMDVFPSTGDAIDAGAANAQVSVAAGKACAFYCAVNGTWNSLFGA